MIDVLLNDIGFTNRGPEGRVLLPDIELPNGAGWVLVGDRLDKSDLG